MKKKLNRNSRRAGRQGASRPPPLVDTDAVVEYLRRQLNMPHPLRTGTGTMMLWLEAMDLGVSRAHLRGLLPRVMELWRKRGDVHAIFTREDQDIIMADADGQDLEPPVLTKAWTGRAPGPTTGHNPGRAAWRTARKLNDGRQDELPLAQPAGVHVNANPGPVQVAVTGERSLRPEIDRLAAELREKERFQENGNLSPP